MSVKPKFRCFRDQSRALPVALALLLTAFSAQAHAILKESSPALHSTVQGPAVKIRLKFNSRIDAAHSRMYLKGDNGARPIEIAGQALPDTLLGEVKDVKPGEYRIQWQVLAIDGHITRGEVPFTVR